MPRYNKADVEQTDVESRTSYIPGSENDKGYGPAALGSLAAALPVTAVRMTGRSGKLAKVGAAMAPVLAGLAGNAFENQYRDITGTQDDDRIFGSDYSKGALIGEAIGFAPEIGRGAKRLWDKIPAKIKNSKTAKGAAVASIAAVLYHMLTGGLSNLSESIYREPKGE